MHLAHLEHISATSKELEMDNAIFFHEDKTFYALYDKCKFPAFNILQ